jgi:hypothetical protein
MMKLLAFFLAFASSSWAMHLTPDNWDAETAGKTIFVKFYAPWYVSAVDVATDNVQLVTAVHWKAI